VDPGVDDRDRARKIEEITVTGVLSGRAFSKRLRNETERPRAGSRENAVETSGWISLGRPFRRWNK
jgi:hypothetical protein